MTYETILVCFRNAAHAARLCKAAALISSRHKAHVIGLFPVQSAEVHAPIIFPGASIITDNQEELHDTEAAEIERIFQKYGAGQETSWEWRYVKSKGAPISRIMATHSLCSDLVVIAQPSSSTSYVEPDMAFETVLMGTGRPVLVVPVEGNLEHIGDHIVAGWNGTREAARAIFDALPMMSTPAAQDTTLIWFSSGEADGKNQVRGSEMASTLARHNVHVEAFSGTASGSVGQAMLEQVRQRGADLLVMGGYGHSRLREFVFGGATDHVLRHMTVPVLMSH